MAGKKREFTFWGCRRQPIKFGELSTEMKQVNPLPKVGTYVVVHECVTFTETNECEQIVTAYRPASSYFDAWGHPVAYRVKSYSEGIHEPLNRDNWITLERRCRNGHVFRATLSALDVAIGVTLLKEVKEADDARKYRSRYYGYKDCIIRETSEDLMRQAMQRGALHCEAV